MTETTPIDEDARWQALMARGGMITLPFDAPNVWPHGPLPAGDKAMEVGDNRLTPAYCSVDGHRFLKALLLLPIQGARTVFGYECWGSVSEESWQSFLAARTGGESFTGSFSWVANSLPGFARAEPIPCNLVAGPPGQPPRLQPQPGTSLHRAQSTGLSAARLAAIYAEAGRDITALLAG